MIYEHIYMLPAIMFLLSMHLLIQKCMPNIKNQSLELVGTYLQSSCDQPEVRMYISYIYIYIYIYICDRIWENVHIVHTSDFAHSKIHKT